MDPLTVPAVFAKASKLPRTSFSLVAQVIGVMSRARSRQLDGVFGVPGVVAHGDDRHAELGQRLPRRLHAAATCSSGVPLLNRA